MWSWRAWFGGPGVSAALFGLQLLCAPSSAQASNVSQLFAAPRVRAESGEPRGLWFSMPSGDAFCRAHGWSLMEDHVSICGEASTPYLFWDGSAWVERLTDPPGWGCASVFESIVCSNAPSYDLGAQLPETLASVRNGDAFCVERGHPGMQAFQTQCAPPHSQYLNWTAVPPRFTSAPWAPALSGNAGAPCLKLFSRLSCRQEDAASFLQPTHTFPDGERWLVIGEHEGDRICQDHGYATSEFLSFGCGRSDLPVDIESFYSQEQWREVPRGGGVGEEGDGEAPNFCIDSMGALGCTNLTKFDFPRAPGDPQGEIHANKRTADEICRLRGFGEMHTSMSFCVPPGFTVLDWDGAAWRALPLDGSCVPILDWVTCLPATITSLPAGPRWAALVSAALLLAIGLALATRGARSARASAPRAR